MTDGKRWTVQDRYDREIYLTHERWRHIIDPTNHPEMARYEDQLKETIQRGMRRQDVPNPQKYQYSKAFDGLAKTNTHIVAIVLFRFSESESGQPAPNNYIVTAYQKEMR